MLKKQGLFILVLLCVAITMVACGKNTDDKEAVISGMSSLLEAAQGDDSEPIYLYTGSYSEETNIYSVEVTVNENCVDYSDVDEVVRKSVIAMENSDSNIHPVMENLYTAVVDYLAGEDIGLEIYHIDNNGEKCYYSGTEDDGNE